MCCICHISSRVTVACFGLVCVFVSVLILAAKVILHPFSILVDILTDFSVLHRNKLVSNCVIRSITRVREISVMHHLYIPTGWITKNFL